METMNCIPTRYNGAIRVLIHVLRPVNEETKEYKPNLIKAQRIANGVFDYLRVSRSLMIVKTRKTEVVEAKRISIYLISNNCKLKDKDQAQMFNLDRTDIIYHRNKCDDLMFSDKEYKEKITSLIEILSLK